MLAVAAAVAGCSSTSNADDADDAPNVVALDPEVELAGDPERISDAIIVIADDAENIDRLVMIGDSITVGARDALEAEFVEIGIEYVIEARNGKRLVVSGPDNLGGATIAEGLRGTEDTASSEVWVIALGTNDIAKYAGPDEIAGAVNEMLANVPDEAALVWVDTYIRGLDEETAAVNAVIRDRVARRGNAVVTPWTAFAEGDGVMSDDGVHPTEAGSNLFAAVIGNTVAGFLGR